MGQEQWEGHWRDYYDVLQVSINAEPETITAAKKVLSKKYHPDSGTAPNEERMKLINEAAEILLDPAKRARYDSAYRDCNRTHDKAARAAGAKNPRKQKDAQAQHEAERAPEKDAQAAQSNTTQTFWNSILKIGAELVADSLKRRLQVNDETRSLESPPINLSGEWRSADGLLYTFLHIGEQLKVQGRTPFGLIMLLGGGTVNGINLQISYTTLPNPASMGSTTYGDVQCTVSRDGRNITGKAINRTTGGISAVWLCR